MSRYASKAFWVATGERVVATFAETAGAMLGADGLGLLDADWHHVLNIAGLAAVLTLGKALVAAQVGTAGPSLTRSETLSPPAPQIDADDPRAQ